jgi:FMN phosphatase YigB (HAD superfamily)
MAALLTPVLLQVAVDRDRRRNLEQDTAPAAAEVPCRSREGHDVRIPHDTVFLFDVDNTLLDNDRVEQDLRTHLTEAFGAEQERRYWAIFESLRAESGYADYLGALQRYRVEHPRDPRLLEVSTYLIDYPFAERLYPGALRALRSCQERAPVVLLTDGDVVFQPRKIERSGLGGAVAGHVLIYVHKEEMLDDVEARYPARHYVMVDDKLRILTTMQRVWGERLTTVFVRQGRYALDPQTVASYPPADLTLERIGDLAEYDLTLLDATTDSGRATARVGALREGEA